MVQEFSAARAADTVPECWKTTDQWILRQWRQAFPAAPSGSSGGSALRRGFLALLRDVRFVRGCVHQIADTCGIGEPHFNQPSRAVRIVVDGLWFILKLAIGLNHFATGRSVNFAYGLD